MCFSYKLSKEQIERINKKLEGIEELFKDDIKTIQFNAFTHPQAPVITNDAPDKVQLLQWGLLPHWAKDKTIQNSTLNARIETIHEKPSFRDCVNQRCLIPADGFYEWQWLDEKGKNKQKYHIHIPDEELFYFAGLWSKWTDKQTGELLKTYTILTSEANPLMAETHNTKKRMPIIVQDEKEWLESGNILYKNDLLIADKLI